MASGVARRNRSPAGIGGASRDCGEPRVVVRHEIDDGAALARRAQFGLVRAAY
jgi:hypothetical protein